MNCNGRRNLAFETIPTFHGRSDRHERHFTPGVRKRRTAFPVNGCLPIRTNVVMQRQKGCISVHPEFQFCRLNTNKLGREPRPRHPLNKERTICIIGVSLTYLYESIPPIMFLLSAGFFGGIAMAIYSPLLILINWRTLPEPFRPSRLRLAILILVSGFYGCFAIVAVVMLLRRLTAG